MKLINVGNKNNAHAKKQTTLASFLMRKESNVTVLAKETLKRHVQKELAEEANKVEQKKQRALIEFNKIYNISNAKIIREGICTEIKRGIVNAMTEYDRISTLKARENTIPCCLPEE